MIVDGSGLFHPKRRRTDYFDSMDPNNPARAKFAEVKEKFGRELRVFETSPSTPTQSPAPDNREEADEFYEFTPEDYYRLMGAKKEEKFLKTKKIRDAEEAARRSRITKTVIRVRFPDSNTLEVTFHPSEKLQSLVDLLQKVLARPDLPFYLFTTPPKKRIDDLSQDFYLAGFVPGAIVYFSNDMRKDENGAASETGPYLGDDVMALKGLEHVIEQEESVQSAAPPPVEAVVPAPVAQERKPAEKKVVKPKWLKM
ncbi:hypothetical protein MLD38_033653 [Melastoma candidum]|uniref:Uncharacterized protein n=1 Tax=Melastoma candidum TaxID=119954 RepID=A0ACB9M791_9MYRT|nr:hypothetical protein MLD38_033653 [Melastoma candidum]